MSSAAAQPFSLVALLSTLKIRYPHAEVTGRFNDWRTLSQYRSHAGLHYGYDIALPYGSDVPAAWGGRVVAITNWSGPQYGITIDCGGVEATYGHLMPLVSVGQVIAPGQAVGRTLIDHVDVKMRDGAGRFIDYGAGVDGNAVSPEAIALNYRQAVLQEEQALSAIGLWKANLTRLESSRSLGKPSGDWKELYEEGAVSRHDYEVARKQLDASLSLPERIAKARQHLSESRKAYNQAHTLRTQLASLVPTGMRGGPVASATSSVAAAKPIHLTAELKNMVEEGTITHDEAMRLARHEAHRE